MTISQLPFGRTGHLSSRIIFGAAALSWISQDVADRTLELLLEHGINHIDVAASYGDAELRVAPWLKRHSDHFFSSRPRRASVEPARRERSSNAPSTASESTTLTSGSSTTSPTLFSGMWR